MRLYCATTNPGKLREFRMALADSLGVEALPGLGSIPPCEETGVTFEENAVQKALYYSKHCDGLLFVDDSGLEVDALGGAPGVHSARYAGDHATDAANNALLPSPSVLPSLDLRNNLKFTSYGHVNVLRVEVMQLLDEAYRILGSDDIKRIFGADTAWDVIEIILAQYFGERLVTSPRQGMAIAGRELLRWLAQPHVLQTQRTKFETLLLEIAENAEEWLTSAQSLGLAVRQEDRRVMPWDRSALPAGGGERVARPPVTGRPMPPMARAGAGTRGRMPVPNGSRP